MPRAKKQPKISREEILERAARNVAHMINPEAMGMEPKEVPVEEFVKYFKEKASEMLNQIEGRMLLTTGTYMNKEHTLYSKDLQPIVDYIEEKMGLELQFFNGIIVYFGDEDIGVGWIPDRPF